VCTREFKKNTKFNVVHTWYHTVAHIHVPHIYSYLYPVTVPVCIRGTRVPHVHIQHDDTLKGLKYPPPQHSNRFTKPHNNDANQHHHRISQVPVFLFLAVFFSFPQYGSSFFFLCRPLENRFHSTNRQF
jgi:hypothetical protein